ncbi:hypothetical protein [Oceaniferula marina]|nr:hypothetical protein [Oceaniferula marina]
MPGKVNINKGVTFRAGSIFKAADGSKLVAYPLNTKLKIGGHERMSCRRYGMKWDAIGSFEILWTKELDLALTFFSSDEDGGKIYYPDWGDNRTRLEKV